MRVRYSFSSRRTGIIEGTNKHREAFPKLAKEVVRISDVILEVLDARFIEQTRNKELEDLVLKNGKTLMFVCNKADLVDQKALKRTLEEQNMVPFAIISCKTFLGKKALRDRIKIEVKRRKMPHKAHVGIVGYPNTGKSSLINMLIGRKAAPVSQQSGFTKGIQKLRLTSDILLLDTPGVIAEEDKPSTQNEDMAKSVKVGVKTYDKVRTPFLSVADIMRMHPGVVERKYEVKVDNDPGELVEILGKKWNFFVKGGLVDVNRVSRKILHDWQKGNIKL